MNTKDIIDSAEAIAFVEKLVMNDNTIDVGKTEQGVYRISWIENKKYTSFSGEIHTDEVWTTENGNMIACQDLELEHAKNIIRMILRKEREQLKFLQKLEDKISEIQDATDTADTEIIERILH